MRINHRLMPIYSTLATFIILFLSAVGSYAHQDNERDPFRFGSAHSPQPGYETGEDGDGAVLQMTLITDRHRIAVFNGRRYQEGDSIGRYIVTGIELDKVTVENKEDKKVFAPHRK